MRNLNQEEQNYTKQDATLSVYYDCVKDSFLTRDWTKLKHKWGTIMAMYKNGLTINDAIKSIRQILKK